jgi:hypothetical protein
MPRYLSPEWVQAFDAALSQLDLTEAIAAVGRHSVTASEGSFTVAQVVPDAPGGLVRTVLVVGAEPGRVTLVSDAAETVRADVTILLGYDDARAMSRGELEPADALDAGRVRVRGELSVLVAGQAVLAAAAAALGPALAGLTDDAD